MNKTQTIINAVLGVCVATLLVLVIILFTRQPAAVSDEWGEFAVDTTGMFDTDTLVLTDTTHMEPEAIADPKGRDRKPKLPVAYVNMDRVNKEYKFVKDANARLNSMAEASREKLLARYNTLQQSLQKQEQDLIQRAQSGQIASEEVFVQQRTELERKLQASQAELAQMEQDLAVKNEAELKRQAKELNDRITKFLREYNSDGRYELILSNLGEINDNILYSATPAYDITDDVIRGLNARYGKK